MLHCSPAQHGSCVQAVTMPPVCDRNTCGRGDRNRHASSRLTRCFWGDCRHAPPYPSSWQRIILLLAGEAAGVPAQHPQHAGSARINHTKQRVPKVTAAAATQRPRLCGACESAAAICSLQCPCAFNSHAAASLRAAMSASKGWEEQQACCISAWDRLAIKDALALTDKR